MDDLHVVFQDNPRTALGEGPCWHAKKQILYWIDIRRKLVHIFDPKLQKNETIDVKSLVGCVVPAKSGKLIVALQNGIYYLDPTTKQLSFIDDPEVSKPENRFNDGKVDPSGRFWAGTMEDAEKGEPLGSLYSMEGKEKKMKKRFGPVAVSNGLAWPNDRKTMYYIDSPTKEVVAFDYNLETGDISNKRTVIKIEDGWPDGMTIDKEGSIFRVQNNNKKGMLWVAHWLGSKVTRWDPSNGKLLRTVKMPTSKITSCCFGGPNLDELYITSASLEIDTEKEPLAGALFVLKNPGVKGFEELEFLDE